MTNDQTVTQADRELLAGLLRNQGASDQEVAYCLTGQSQTLSDECEQGLVADLKAVSRHRTAHSGEGRSKGAGDVQAVRHALTDAISMLDHIVEQTGYASGSGSGDYAAQEELSDHREKWRAALAQPEAGGEQ